VSLSYKVIRSNRKTIAIQIMPNGDVLVRSPNRASESEIRKFVESKSAWVQKHLSGMNAERAEPFSKDQIEVLRRQTKLLVEERAAHYCTILGVTYHQISVRTQRTRWGSCSSKGNLNFNCLLALVPADVLDYVVVHELCHLKEMNHSNRFWELVRGVLPDYEHRKRWLVENGRRLISRIS